MNGAVVNGAVVDGAAPFGFAHPWVLALLLLVPLWGLWRWLQRRRATVHFGPLQVPRAAPRPRFLGRLRGCLGGLRQRFLGWLVPVVEMLLLVVTVVGVAGPHGVQHFDRLEDEGVDVMLVLDVSLSMLAEDFPPNRLAALRELTADFLERAGGNRLGLVVFAGDAYVQSPLTTDRVVLRSLLDGVGVYLLHQGVSGGTAIGDALLVAGERLRTARVEGRDQAVVLITDGNSNLGIDPVLAARHLGRQGVRLYAVGIGGTEPVTVTFEGEPLGNPDDPYVDSLDDARLAAVARAAGGRFFRATDVGALEAVLDELSRLERAPLEVRRVVTRVSYAPALALAVLSLFAAHLMLAGVVTRRPYR